MKQMALDLRTWGGKRKDAGRQPKGRVALVSHDVRPELDGRTPVHVVLRVVDDVPSLRTRPVFEEICAAFKAGGERNGFRLTHYAVLGNHLHLIVEAGSKKELSRGMQALAIRIARAVNRVAERKGRVFADHYFAHQLKTPTEVRHAIRYVLENRAIHDARQGRPARPGVDRFSSAVEGAPVRPATFWLLTIGWRRARGVPRWDRRVPL